MIDLILDVVLKWLVVVVWGIAAYAEFSQHKHLKGKPYRWVKFAIGVMAIYWVGYYLRSIIGIDLGRIHQVWVRAPLVLTGAFVAAGALMTLQRLRKENPL